MVDEHLVDLAVGQVVGVVGGDGAAQMVTVPLHGGKELGGCEGDAERLQGLQEGRQVGVRFMPITLAEIDRSRFRISTDAPVSAITSAACRAV